VGGALTLKARHYAFGLPAKKDGEPATGATVDDLAESLKSIHWALAGDSDATLVSQLKLSRQDSNDRLDALKKAQTEALRMLSEMGSKALVEALRDVIRDFNARINEQFGENFKHLNDGVAKLLVWQEQHRQHVDAMATRLDEILKIAESTADTHKQVVDQSAIFAKIAVELSALLTALETQKEQIKSYAQSLAALLNSAKDAVPQIENRITAIAAQLAEAASKNQQTMSRAVEESAASINRTLEDASKAASKAADEHNKQIAQLVAKSKEQIDLLDAALSEELKKSLEALGGQLAALSEKFVSDYMPLTARLREVVRMTEGV
jgi:DNA anti-recombination protein RmuC